ncbi:ANTAR domain-containing protein [Streptomyces sp. NBC_01571]|uniref:ANTAR domain-containing protein n=1 Tax=Streptomyces sp. NBC_01571 TaxID=2975883 RepID=UPI002256CF93|nr:ANTAR domain-containing protein [Streptomyces sp. NBC_01571]MCX4575200.1 ANTAR domain-containing protein [Streptomyces sp. NBC_01571]
MHPSTRETRLAAALMEAADTLSDSFDTAHYLQRLSDHCVEIVGAHSAGIMLVAGAERVSFVGSSRRQDIALDLLTVQAAPDRRGPCLDSYGTGRPVPHAPIGAARTAARWPDFTRRALRHGIAATFAVPLRRRETLFGALNVFVPPPSGPPEPPGPREPRGRPEPLGDEESVRLAQLLAEAAAAGLHNQRLHAEYRTLAGQLQSALSRSVRVEQAKGILAERWNTGVDQAFPALRRYARRHRIPLDEVAARVVAGSLDRDGLDDERPRPV